MAEETMIRKLTEEETRRFLELTNGELKPGYEGLTTEEAIEVIMLLDRVGPVEAAERLAFARGEAAGCLSEFESEESQAAA